jgi:eukaryotic-like serine/threonine-protein kinase
MRAHGGKVYRLAMSPDTRLAATLGGNHPEANHFGRPLNENEIQLWALDADRPLWTLSRRSNMERMEFSVDGETLFLAQALLVEAYDVRSGKRRYSVRTTGAMGGMDTVIAFSGDRGLAAIPDREGLRVFETATATTVQSMSLRSATGFALSADGSFAVTGGFDRLVRVWDVRTGKCLRTLEGHRSPINQVVLNRDGTLLASADLGSALWAWELAWDYDFPAGDDR